MRLFFALELPGYAQRALGAAQAALAAAEPELRGRLRWSPQDSLHLTLAFLGDTDASRLPALEGLGAAAAARCGPLALSCGGYGAFPRWRAARVLWLSLDGSPGLPGLMALAGRLREGLAENGVRFDDKPFAPHLTLARSPRPLDLRGYGWGRTLLDFSADRVSLFESRPGARSAYERHWTARLEGAQAGPAVDTGG